MLLLMPVVVIDGEEYMDRDEVARHLGVLPNTVSAWVSRSKLPEPDRYLGKSPLWLIRTIMSWEEGRPGKGHPRPR